MTWESEFKKLQKFLLQWHHLPPIDEESVLADKPSHLGAVLYLLHNLCEGQIGKIVYNFRIVNIKDVDTFNYPFVFCHESNGACSWSIEDGSEDPIVGWGATRSNVVWNAEEKRWRGAWSLDPWSPEKGRLCNFLRGLFVQDAIIHAPYGASCSWCSDEDLSFILTNWEPFDICAWQWPAFPTTFYFAGDALASVSPNRGGYSFKCGTQTKGSLSFIHDNAISTWDYMKR